VERTGLPLARGPEFVDEAVVARGAPSVVLYVIASCRVVAPKSRKARNSSAMLAVWHRARWCRANQRQFQHLGGRDLGDSLSEGRHLNWNQQTIDRRFRQNNFSFFEPGALLFRTHHAKVSFTLGWSVVCGLLAGHAAVETLKLTDGQTLTGEPISFSEQGLVVRLETASLQTGCRGEKYHRMI